MKGVTGGPAGLPPTAGGLAAACLALMPAAIMAMRVGTLAIPHTREVDCFVVGTTIATPGGDRPIEDMRVGDVVLCRDARGNAGSCRITNVTRRTAGSVRRFVLDDGNELSMAGDHMLRTARGWAAASEVSAGTAIETRRDRRAIRRVNVVTGDHDVCDITPDGSGAFFANGVLVHR